MRGRTGAGAASRQEFTGTPGAERSAKHPGRDAWDRRLDLRARLDVNATCAITMDNLNPHRLAKLVVRRNKNERPSRSRCQCNRRPLPDCRAKKLVRCAPLQHQSPLGDGLRRAHQTLQNLTRVHNRAEPDLSTSTRERTGASAKQFPANQLSRHPELRR